VLENTDAATLNKFVRKTVSDKVDLVATDEHRGYAHLDAIGFEHEAVSHSTGEYVRGNVHTNNIESFWSLLKRGVMGSYHKVSKKYLPLYLAEFSFRHNNRKNPDMFGALIRSRMLSTKGWRRTQRYAKASGDPARKPEQLHFLFVRRMSWLKRKMNIRRIP
jgi:transposase-like protein